MNLIIEKKINQLVKEAKHVLVKFTPLLAIIQRLELKIAYPVLAFVGIFFLAVFYVVAIGRVDYPFDLEWMEGGTVDHVIRVLNGQKLYVIPSPDFVPYIYTPFSYYMGAVFSFLLGEEGYLPLRILSILSISIVFYIIYLLIHFETKKQFLGIAGAGLFASTYIISNNWFDIGRVDSLFLCLLLLSLYFLRAHGNKKHYFLSALFLYLAFLTKQSAILLYPACVIYAFHKNTKRGFYYLLMVVILTYFTIKLYDLTTDNWFSYYVFEVGSGHELLGFMIKDFWKVDLFEKFEIPFIVSIIYLMSLFLRPLKTFNIFYILCSLSLIGLGYFGRIHSGGDTNVLMPTYMIISILCMLSLHQLSFSYKQIPFSFFTTLLFIGLLMQFNKMRYSPLSYIPTQQDISAGKSLTEFIESIDEPVMISSHGYYQKLVGKKTNAHFMATYDLLRSVDHLGKEIIKNSTVDRILSKYYHTIIQDNDYFIDEVNSSYVLIKEIEYPEAKTFIPKSGAQVRPIKIYQRKQ